jgi:pilus assembly protein CpaF
LEFELKLGKEATPEDPEQAARAAHLAELAELPGRQWPEGPAVVEVKDAPARRRRRLYENPIKAKQPKAGSETGQPKMGRWARLQAWANRPRPGYRPVTRGKASARRDVPDGEGMAASWLETGQEAVVVPPVEVERRTAGGLVDPIKPIKARLHKKVLEEMAERKDWTPAAARVRVLEIVDAAFALQPTQLRRSGERAELVKSLLNDVFGLGPIQKLVDDPEVDEIMVNGPNEIFVERHGRIYATDVKFDSEQHELSVIERIVGQVGRRVDESFPMVDARLSDGSRVNVILSPLSLRGPCLTIRKFRSEHYTAEQLIGMGTASGPILDFLKAAVRSRENILVTGSTSSGKTTLLNVLSGYINENERIVTIEDAAELRLGQPHVVPLETRPPNAEGRGQVAIRDLVRNALRMRPDRIVVGEVRGPEALDMIQAMNTGHDGSMSTLHANSSEDALQRLEAMAMMAGVELPSESIRFQICSAISLVVHTERVSGGARKIVDVSEVMRERGEMHTQTIFAYKQTGVDDAGDATGLHTVTGVLPACLARIRARGMQVDERIFAVATTVPPATSSRK